MMGKLYFLRSQPKACHYGARISDWLERVLFLFLNDFIEQFPMINLAFLSKERIRHILNPCIRITYRCRLLTPV